MQTQPTYKNTWDRISSEASHFENLMKEKINKSNTSIIQPALKTVKSYSPLFHKGLDLIAIVAIKTFKFLAAFSLFAAQTTTFLIGAAIAMVFPEAMRASIDRISKVWNSLPFILKVAAFVPFPFAWASYFLIASPFVGANVSLYFQDKAGVQRPNTTPSTPSPAPTQEASTQTINLVIPPCSDAAVPQPNAIPTLST
jgi:hypothetical protein